MTAYRFVGTMRVAGSTEPADVDGVIVRESHHDARAALCLIIALGEWGVASPQDLTVYDEDRRVVERWRDGWYQQ